MAKRDLGTSPGFVTASAEIKPIIKTKESVRPVESVEDKKTNSNFFRWGANNRLPLELIELVEKSDILAPRMHDLAALACGDGIYYETFTEAGAWKETYDQEIEDFLLDNDIVQGYLYNVFYNFYFFRNAWADASLNRLRSKITRLSSFKSEQVRYGLQNKHGYIEEIGVNANWGKPGASWNTSIKIPLIDTRFKPVEQIQNASSYRFALPVTLTHPSPGTAYYSRPPWYSVVENGWYEFALLIPQFKKAMMNNQLALKYQIEVNTDYWKLKYNADWDEWDMEKRKSAMQKEISDFNKAFTGTENALRSILTHIAYNAKGDPVSMWKITAIDDKVKSDIYIEDSQEAGSHFYSALSLDTAVFGAQPGKGFGAGSGSDKNAAYNIHMIKTAPLQGFALRPMNIIARYNGWSTQQRPLRFKIRTLMLHEQTSGKPKAGEKEKSTQTAE